MSEVCELCGRPFDYRMGRFTPGKPVIHHLTPRDQKRVRDPPTAKLCKACHHMIHRTFENWELEQHYNTVEKLREDPKIQRFTEWLRKHH